MSRRKRRLLERLAAEERLTEFEHTHLIVESLKLEVKSRKRRERMAREILKRQGWKSYVV